MSVLSSFFFLSFTFLSVFVPSSKYISLLLSAGFCLSSFSSDFFSDLVDIIVVSCSSFCSIFFSGSIGITVELLLSFFSAFSIDVAGITVLFCSSLDTSFFLGSVGMLMPFWLSSVFVLSFCGPLGIIISLLPSLSLLVCVLLSVLFFSGAIVIISVGSSSSGF